MVTARVYMQSLAQKNALLPPVAFSTYTVLATDELEGGVR